MTDSQQKPATILSVQYLRAVAALLVAVSHLTITQAIFFPEKNPAVPIFNGVWGVDIFFVISGFIMVYITHNRAVSAGRAGQFMLDRASRIIPAYWFFTFIVFFIAPFAAEHFADVKAFTVDHLVRSLLFIKVEAFPVLLVGWTLNYEMYFYLLFAFTLVFLSPGYRLLFLNLFFIICVLLGWLVDNDSRFWPFFTNPILLEFCYGMGIAHLYLRNVRVNSTIALTLFLLGWALVVSGLLNYDDDYLLNNRTLYWGVPSAFIVFGLLNLSVQKYIKVFAYLGDISYSIYLCHLPVAVFTAMSLKIMSGWGWLPVWFNFTACFLVLSFVLVILCSMLSHRWIEVYLRRVIRGG